MFRILIALVFFGVSAFAAQINGAGASFPANVYMVWVKDYEAKSGVKINYQSIGSGGGVKQVKAGTIDFGASDEALGKSELEASKLAQFPTLSGAIVLVYNLDGIADGALKLSDEAISGIFLGKITKWNDEIIAKDNPNLKLPNLEISVIHRSDGSGTTFNFTSYLSKISKTWSDEIGFGKAISWKVGVGAKGNEGLAHLVKSVKGAIGYTELSYKENLALNAAQIKNKNGEWVSANKDSITLASKNAKLDSANAMDLLLQGGKGVYPIVNATYILIPLESKNKAAIGEFFNYAFESGDQSALKMGLVPLDSQTKKQIRGYLKANEILK